MRVLHQLHLVTNDNGDTFLVRGRRVGQSDLRSADEVSSSCIGEPTQRNVYSMEERQRRLLGTADAASNETGQR